jgi:hypothetical protein
LRSWIVIGAQEAGMAADVNTGMEKGEMKRLLAKSKKEPVNCALGQGDDNTTALLLLDKVKAGKSVEKELTKQFPDAKNTRFGTAVVDVDVDPKKVIFTVNKPVSSMARKLVKTLKGTGFSKAEIRLEDGTPLEDFDEEAAPPPVPGQGDAAPAAAPAQAQAPEPDATSSPAPAATPQPAAPAAAAPPPGPDFTALAKTLGDLVKRIAQLDPAQQDGLKRQAMQVALLLKAQDAAAVAALDDLGDAIDAAPAPAANGTGTAPALPSPAAVATYTKARAAWLATRQKVETDIGKLQTSFSTAFKDHAMAADLETAFQTRVETVLVNLDHELAQKLDAAVKATDPAQHAQMVGEARDVMRRYQDFVASDPTLSELDANPFVPLAIQKTLTATLSVLAKSLA